MLQGPHWQVHETDAAAEFAVLKLVLLPRGPALPLKYRDNLIGRHSECDLRLPLPDVSRRHCRIVLENGEWRITDLQSLNGVFVNETRVEESNLRHGDIVRVGGFRFKVDLNEHLQTIRLSAEELKALSRKAS